MERTYDSSDYEKHKAPHGWGSLCPPDLEDEPQVLLESGVEVGKSIYNVSGRYALCAETHRPDTWHGYPIPWSRLPAAAKKALEEKGRLTHARFLKAIRQNLGREFL